MASKLDGLQLVLGNDSDSLVKIWWGGRGVVYGYYGSRSSILKGKAKVQVTGRHR